MIIEPVDLTPKACDEIKAIMTKKSIPKGYGLRIFVVDQGISCGATNYSVGFDKETDADITYIACGLKIIVKKSDVVHLAGLQLEYVTEKQAAGFSFNRPD